MNFFRSCVEASQIICGSFEENAILTGVSDTIIVKQKDGTYKSTPFLVCFGPYLSTHKDEPVQILINGTLVPDVRFSLDYKGYIHPQQLPDRQVRKLHLNFGVNKVVYQLEGCRIEAEIYLYASNDKLVVSDVDGTVTKNDIGGHINNFFEKDYLHEGYADLAQRIDKNGYKVVWLTMRALPLYNYSKSYLRQTVGVDGPIMMEPEEFMRALSKELLKKTGNIKANMMNLLSGLFTSNPFMAGLGNRENDAVAYLHAGVPLEKIFIVDTKSRVQVMNEGRNYTSYA